MRRRILLSNIFACIEADFDETHKILNVTFSYAQHPFSANAQSELQLKHTRSVQLAYRKVGKLENNPDLHCMT